MGDTFIDPRPEGKPAQPPAAKRHDGAYAALVPVDVTAHGDDLWVAGQDPGIWTHMPTGPFKSREEFDTFLMSAATRDDLIYYTIVDQKDQRPLGMMAHMRIFPANASIEIGGIWFGPELKRSRIATEAIYLSIAYPMDQLGFLRMEWKCDDLNEASKAAAKRFGFIDEGVHRQHMVVKGRRRNTRWLSILDSEWPEVRARFERWLDPSNFDGDGRQKVSLSDI